METILFGGGCFWCTEAVFSMIKGIVKVTSGYSGGAAENPTYEQVSTGRTGHAEVVKVEYDPKMVSLEKLMKAFFSAHDPTTPDRQGADVGSQYRSAIFYTTAEQKEKAEKFIGEIRKNFTNPIVTEIREMANFYPAEEYHQRYFERNPERPYCSCVIAPKVAKAEKMLKSD